MNNSIESGKLIEDKAIAAEVAHSAKASRSIAAAKRFVDPLAEEAAGMGRIDFVKHPAIASRIMGSFAVYPEVFYMLFPPSNRAAGFTWEELSAAVSKIFQIGELPTRNIVGWEDRNDAEAFDNTASTIENVTEALLVHPPTQDFLRDFNLGKEVYLGSKSAGYKFEVTVGDVTDLLLSADDFDRELDVVMEGFAVDWQQYDQLATEADHRSNKLDTILGMIQEVGAHISHDESEYKKEYEGTVQAAKNSGKTTLSDFEAVYLNGTARVIELLRKTGDQYRATYDNVLSGAASEYKTPDIAIPE